MMDRAGRALAMTSALQIGPTNTASDRDLRSKCPQPEQHARERTYADTMTRREQCLQYSRGARISSVLLGTACHGVRARGPWRRRWYPRGRRSTQHAVQATYASASDKPCSLAGASTPGAAGALQLGRGPALHPAFLPTVCRRTSYSVSNDVRRVVSFFSDIQPNFWKMETEGAVR